MEKILQVIKRKQSIFIIVNLIYIVIVTILKWSGHVSIDMLWFVLGSLVGVYVIDLIEEYLAIQPSPFRTVVFQVLFIVVSIFIVTSSQSLEAIGLVLSVYLQVLMLQIGEMRATGNVGSWYTMISTPVSLSMQKMFLVIVSALFIIESYLFIR